MAIEADPSDGEDGTKDEVRQAVRALWVHFAAAGAFSGLINLLYLSSPLYLMQVYNRVLVNENVTTLMWLTLMLAIALLTMAVLDVVRAQCWCGVVSCSTQDLALGSSTR